MTRFLHYEESNTVVHCGKCSLPPTLTNAGTYVLVLPHPLSLLFLRRSPTKADYFANSETHIFSFDRVLKSSEKVLFPLLTNCVT